MRKGIANALANQIFGLQRTTHGGVPGEVVGAARRVKEGVGNARDLEMMRNYLGIKRSGATMLKRGVSDFNQTLDRVGQIGVLGTQVASGGAQGAFATLQLAQIFARQLELSARSGALRKIIETTYKTPQNAVKLDRSIRAGALQQMTNADNVADRLAGRKMFYSKNAILDENKRLRKMGVRNEEEQSRFEATESALGSIRSNVTAARASRLGIMGKARMLGAGVGLAAFGLEATKGVVSLAESLGGLNQGDVRSAQQASRIANVDSMATDADKKVARLQIEAEKAKAKLGFLNGTAIGSLYGGQLGEDQGFAQTRSDLARAGISANVDKLRKKAQESVLEKEKGAFFGRLANKREEAWKAAGFSNVELEQKISAEVQKTIQKFQEFYNGAQSAAGRRDFRRAQVLLDEANKTLPGQVPAWMNPQSMYAQSMGDRVATRLFAATQMARAGDRTGD